jgi:hypothetical protein
MGMLATGIAAHNALLFRSEGELCVYRRGATAKPLRIVFGSTTFEEETRGGTVVQTRSMDCLALTADFLETGFVNPQPGDRVEKTDPVTEKALAFEVMSPGGSQCWRYSDTHRSRMRMHTKQVSEQ